MTTEEAIADARKRFGMDAFAGVRAHPGFVAAMRASNAGMLALHDADTTSGGVLRDIGRMMAATLALHLHYSGGLTLARLRDICEQLGVTSRGRAFAILGLLRMIGYVRPAGGSGDGRVRAYEPTEVLHEVIRARLVIELTAAQTVGFEKDIGPVLDRLEEPEVFGLFMASVAETLLTARLAARADVFDFDLFSHRTAGLVILGHLLASGDDGRSFPPTGKVPLSVAALSRKFKVSRTHIMRLLRDAEAADLMARGDNENEIYLRPKLIWELEGYFAAAFLFMADCSRLTQARLLALSARG